MSMINRLVRAFETLSNVELNEKDRGGMRGEDNAAYIIEDGQEGCSIRNPIIPHPRKRGYYLETDFLVYARGTLYCVEIKNYRGKVYYPARYRTASVQKGWFIFKYTVQQSVFDHYDYTKMVQEKMGYNGAGPIIREMPNPLLKTQQYIEDLKRYLNKLDARFSAIPIYPALGFAERTDISAIDDFDAGIMHISQLPRFFEKRGNAGFRVPESWVMQALQKLPTWDRILTTENEWINGTILDQTLNFKDTNGRQQSIAYARIRSIDLKREGSFSAHDTLTVTFTNGSSQSFRSVGGEVRLNRFQGEMQMHKLRNINRLLVGIVNR